MSKHVFLRSSKRNQDIELEEEKKEKAAAETKGTKSGEGGGRMPFIRKRKNMYFPMCVSAERGEGRRSAKHLIVEL